MTDHDLNPRDTVINFYNSVTFSKVIDWRVHQNLKDPRAEPAKWNRVDGTVDGSE